MGLVALSQFWEFPIITQQIPNKIAILSQNWESEIFPVIRATYCGQRDKDHPTKILTLLDLTCICTPVLLIQSSLMAIR